MYSLRCSNKSGIAAQNHQWRNTGANAQEHPPVKKIERRAGKDLEQLPSEFPYSIAAIKHLLDLANEFHQDDIRTKQLGWTEDELAFYDLLSANEKLMNNNGPIQDLLHKVVASVKKNLELDWVKKEDARAAIRLAVKKN